MARLKFVVYPLIFCLMLYGVVILLKYCGFSIVFQESASMPVGYYFVYPSSSIKANNIVLISVSKKLSDFLITRGYLKGNKPLLKEVLAVPGDAVCFHESSVSVANKDFPLFKLDKEGRMLPKIKYCSTLKRGEYFVIGTASEHSFDSRYFGIINGEQILGIAFKL
ncbi:S26 family signal peptidase [Francisellaceae bacterium]|nr:S26 family signal peptidase [Francisellaceae bacterium]